MDSLNNKQTNWFARICILLIGGLLIGMIVYRYFYVTPIADISTGIITLIAFVLVLSLSESFDNFSIGHIINLSKTVKEKEKEVLKKVSEVEKIEVEKRELLTQLISITNNFSQRQSNTNIYGALTPDILKQFGVQKAEETEVSASKQKEELEDDKINVRPEKKRIDYRKLEEYTLNKFIKSSNIDMSKLYKEIKLQAVQGIDPISDTNPIFDAYLNDIDKEVFFEVKLSSTMGMMFKDRLYLMLSKILHYRSLKKTNAFLHLIIVEIPEEREESRLLNMILELFQPALSNNLLKISTIKLDSNEMKSLYRE